MSLLGLPVISTVIPALAFLLGLRYVGSSAAAILSYTEVVVTCAVAWAAFGVHTTPLQLIGCAAIITAIPILNRITTGHAHTAPSGTSRSRPGPTGRSR